MRVKSFSPRKELTRALDAVAIQRRSLPLVAVEDGYAFIGPEGNAGARRDTCEGCSMVMDNVGHNLSHVNVRDTTFVFMSPAPQNEIAALQKRMDWNAPW